MKNLVVIIPSTGYGIRFYDKGYQEWKPLIKIKGKTILEWTLSCLPKVQTYVMVPPGYSDGIIKTIKDPSKIHIVESSRRGKGPADTILDLKNVIDPDSCVLIANNDQYIEWDRRGFTDTLLYSRHGGVIVVEDLETRWSYVKTDNGLVSEVKAKDSFNVSRVVGLYGFRRFSDVIESAEAFVESTERAAPNGEYYVCPLYNYLIDKGDTVIPFSVIKMYALGNESDLRKFEKYHEERYENIDSDFSSGEEYKIRRKL